MGRVEGVYLAALRAAKLCAHYVGGRKSHSGLKPEKRARSSGSFPPHTALLMPLRGPTHSVVNARGLTGLTKTFCKAPGHLQLLCWCWC